MRFPFEVFQCFQRSSFPDRDIQPAVAKAQRFETLDIDPFLFDNIAAGYPKVGHSVLNVFRNIIVADKQQFQREVAAGRKKASLVVIKIKPYTLQQIE